MNETIYISTVFTAGVLSFFSPCILPVLPVYVGYFNKDPLKEDDKVRKIFPIVKALIFVLGLSTSFVLLGFGAGALGGVIRSRLFVQIMGAIVIALGIYQMGLIRPRLLMGEKKVHLKRSQTPDLIGSYLLGFTFSFGWTPCVGPILGTVLGLSATGSGAAYGGLLMAVYAAGLAIPFMLIAIFSELLLGKIKWLYRHLNTIRVIGGILIIMMGVLMITGSVNNIIAFAQKITEMFGR